MHPRAAGEPERSREDRERRAGALIDTLGVFQPLHHPPGVDAASPCADYVIDFLETTRKDGGGADAGTLVGENLCSALPEDVGNAVVDAFHRAGSARRTQRFDVSLARRTVEVTAVPRAGGEIIATFADVTDVRLTAEKLAREEMRFRRIIEGVQDYAIFMLDPDGHVASWNLGAQRIKGYRADEIIGRHFSRFYPQADIDAKKPEHELEEAARVGRFEDEGWRIRKDGSRFWANVVITPIRDSHGTLLGFTKVTRDLTERVRAEQTARVLAAREATARRLEAIQRVTDAALTSPSLDDTLKALVDGLRGLLQGDTATILLREADTDVLVPTASSGIEALADERVRIPIGRGISGRVAATRKPLVVTDLAEEDVSNPLLARELRSLVAAPLIVDKRLIGVIHVGSRERREFLPEDVTLLRMFAERAAWAVDRAHAYAVLAESEERFRSTFEWAAVGIAHFSLDGRLLRANESLQKLTGYSEAYLREHYAELSHPDNPGSPEAAQRVARGEAPNGSFEKRYVRADGSTLWAKVTVSLVRSADGEPRYLIALLEDITARKEHEERMRALLAREQAAVAEQIQVRKQMEEALRARDVFLAVAAHELRTPLTPMRLQVDAMLRDLACADAQHLTSDRFAKKFKVIERQTRRLEALVSNLLDTSRIASGQISLRPEHVEIGDLVDHVAHHYAAEAEAAGSAIERSVEPGLVANVDASRVEQIIANLVSNAIRYGAGKPVTISATSERRDGRSWIRLAVRDRGIGIARDDQLRIFDRFERAASERHYGGLGLGLWITRQLVAALGGEIRVESSLGEGATFAVMLPAGDSGGT